MNLVDLSHTFSVSMPTFPGDDKATIVEVATIKKDGYTNHNLKSGMHVGTHVDAPLHFISEGKCISDISIDRFYGDGVLIDVRGKPVIDIDCLENIKIEKDDHVLFFTGHDQYYGAHDYFLDHPVITEKLAQYLIDKKIKMVGVDMPSPDKYPFAVHKLLLKQDILIIENLTNLKALVNKEFELFAFPIKFETDAAFVRTIAKIK
jgi:kynurenine formamidase